MKQNILTVLLIIFILILNYVISEFFYHRLIFTGGVSESVDVAFSYVLGFTTTALLCIMFFMVKILLSIKW